MLVDLLVTSCEVVTDNFMDLRTELGRFRELSPIIIKTFNAQRRSHDDGVMTQLRRKVRGAVY